MTSLRYFRFSITTGVPKPQPRFKVHNNEHVDQKHPQTRYRLPKSSKLRCVSCRFKRPSIPRSGPTFREVPSRDRPEVIMSSPSGSHTVPDYQTMNLMRIMHSMYSETDLLWRSTQSIVMRPRCSSRRS